MFSRRQQVGKLFEQVEKAALQPLPAGLFPVFEEALRSVHRDGYVEFKKAYYSAPPEYMGRQVWVRQRNAFSRPLFASKERILRESKSPALGRLSSGPKARAEKGTRLGRQTGKLADA